MNPDCRVAGSEGEKGPPNLQTGVRECGDTRRVQRGGGVPRAVQSPTGAKGTAQQRKKECPVGGGAPGGLRWDKIGNGRVAAGEGTVKAKRSEGRRLGEPLAGPARGRVAAPSGGTAGPGGPGGGCSLPSPSGSSIVRGLGAPPPPPPPAPDPAAGRRPVRPPAQSRELAHSPAGCPQRCPGRGDTGRGDGGPGAMFLRLSSSRGGGRGG